jgi:hypothetical protein
VVLASEPWRARDDAARGAAARAVVEASVRTHLPADTRLGFTAAELAEVNRGLPAARRFEAHTVIRDADVPTAP